MHHTKVRSGDGHQNPNIQISRYPDVQMSGYLDIRYHIPDMRYQVSGIRKISENHPKLVFPKSQEKVPTNRANWSYDPIDPSGDLVLYYCSFVECFWKHVFLTKFRAGLGGQTNLFGQDSNIPQFMVRHPNAWWGEKTNGGEHKFVLAWPAFKNKKAD